MKRVSVLLLAWLGAFTVTTLHAQTACVNITFPDGPCAPAPVQFDCCTPGAIGCVWTFSGGANLTMSGPSVINTFAAAGPYTVNAVITLSSGIMVADTQTFVINGKPPLCFSVSPLSGCAPLNACFTGTCPGLTYTWDFCDGDSSNLINVCHAYNAEGCYCMTLVETDANGCQSDTTILNYICVTPPPTACFSTSVSPTSCSVPYTVPYTNCSIGTALQYAWTFNGGTPSTSNSAGPVSVTYNTAGSYGTSLTVTDASGCSSTMNSPGFVNVANNATCITFAHDSLCVGDVQTFSACGALTYQWSVTPSGATISGNTNQNADITFNQPGTYSICVSVTLAGGCSAQKCDTVIVAQQPQASFMVQGNIQTCQPPLSVTVTNTSSSATSFAWQLAGSDANGGQYNGVNPGTLTYNACGGYDITLTTTTGTCISSFTLPSAVQIDCIVPHITIIPSDSLCAPALVGLHGSVDDGVGPYTFAWDFDYSAPGNFQALDSNVTHVYAAGCHHVALQVTNAAGCQATIIAPDSICVGEKYLQPLCFTLNMDSACAPEQIIYTVCPPAITPYNNGCPTTFRWNFGDGTGDQLIAAPPGNATHQYSDTGCFDVRLVRCNCECCDTLIVPHAICIFPPIVNLVLYRDCANPLCIHCSTYGSIGVDSFAWTIPLGGVITYQSPSGDSVVVCFSVPNASYQISVDGYNFLTQCHMIAQQSAATTQLHTDFYYSDTVICAGQTVQVYNTSTGNAQSFWTITDQTGAIVALNYLTCMTSNNCPGIHTFANPGIYTVKLKITDGGSCADSLVKVDYVTVHGLHAGFSLAPSSGCAPLTVAFTDTTHATPYSTPTTWQWNFGDSSSANNTSTQQNPTHVYDTTGAYTVRLCVTDQYNCTNCDSVVNAVTVGQPKVDFYASDTLVCAGSTVCFVNMTTSPLTVTSYAWDFGDPSSGANNTSNLALPCHTYNQNGVYTVKLSVTDIMGCTDSLVRLAYIHVGSIVADFTVAGDTFSTCPPLPVNFINLTSGLDSTFTAQWFFGDGYGSNLLEPFHEYNLPGTYTVTLIMTSTHGCSDTVTKVDYIVIGGPTATVGASADSGCVPMMVTLFANPSTAQSFLWCFGDTSSCSAGGNTVTHYYALADTFVTSVLLCDGAGCCYTRIIDTLYMDSAVAKFVTNLDSVCSNISVQFTDSSHAITDIVQWQWSFGDGATSTLQNPSHVYSAVGAFPVTLTVHSANQCASTYTDTIHVVPGPGINPVLITSPSCLHDTLHFQSNLVATNNIQTFVWNFGDGSMDTTHNPTHVYSGAATYNVVLNVITTNGCASTDTLNVTVHAPPSANAGSDQTICLGNSVQLQGSGGVSYNWQPNVNPNNIATPTVSPTTTSTYSLTITDVNGCTASAQTIVTVVPAPQPGIAFNDSMCSGASTVITAGGGTSYAWTASDSSALPTTNSVTVSPSITTTYTVVVSVGNGCSADTFAVVHVLPLPQPNAGPDTAVCKNETVQLHASGGIHYAWTPASTLNNDTLQSPTTTVTNSTTFNVHVTDAFGCTADGQAVITMLPLPIVIASPDQRICSQTTAMISASGALSYVWHPGQLLNDSTLQQPIASPTDTMVFTVTGTDSFGCRGSDSTVVSVLFPFDALFAPDTCVCVGGCAVLHAYTFVNEAFVYQWSPGTALTNDSSANPTACPTDDIAYQGIVSDGLCYADTGQLTVCVLPLPVVKASNDTLVLAGTTASLNATSLTTGTYSWQPADLVNCSDCAATLAAPPSLTTYTVLLTDANGCRGDDSVVVDVFCNDATVFIPTAFTPDGDGKNDVYVLKGAGFTLKVLRIYDRIGTLVFETNDINKGWDGTYQGKKYEPEVFVYYLEAICSTGEVFSKKGNITLLR